MRKVILAAIFMLCIFQIGTSQQEPRIQKYTQLNKSESSDTFWINTEEVYEYNLNENLIFKSIKNYFPDGTNTHWEGRFYDYYPNHLLKKESIKRYNPDVDLWIAEDFIEYKYDSNNCLVEETFIENVGGKIRKKVNYEVNENCEWIVRNVSTPEWSNDTIISPSHYLVRTYFPDGISYKEEFFYYYSNGDSSEVDRWSFNYFNEAGNEIERQNIYTSTQHTGYLEEKFTTDYDQFENRVRRSKFKRESDTADWIPNYIINFQNEYDDTDFLIERSEELISYSTGEPILNLNSINKAIFKNSCEGIPELIETNYEGFQSSQKEIFIYKGINECFDLEKINLSIQVFPNPSTGYFEISSPIFQTGNTEILVYSMDGKVLLQKTENSRLTFSNIDLTFLQNGLYILQLRNRDHFVKEKFVIAK